MKTNSQILQHQFQPTPTTCVQTCLAMVLGRPAEEIIEEIGHPGGLPQRQLLESLDRYDIHYAQTLDGALWPGWQFAAVPSLNIRGGMHEVLVHLDDHNRMRVLDPSPKTRYLEDGSDLMSWCDVVLVRVCWVISDQPK